MSSLSPLELLFRGDNYPAIGGRRKHHVKSQKHYAPKEVEVFELLEEESRVSDSILDITSDDSDDGIYFYEDIE